MPPRTSVRNADRDLVIFDRWNGGLSPSIKGGGGFAFAYGIDIHEDPAYFKALPRTVKEPATTMTASTGDKFPTANDANHWTNPNNAHASDDTDANTNSAGDHERYKNFDFPVPVGATITGIEVKVEGQWISLTNATLIASLSWDGGTTWTSTKSINFTSASDETLTYGTGSTDLWGRTWAASEFSNANFKARFIQGSGGRDIDVDAITINVYYTSDASDLIIDAVRVKNGDTYFLGYDKVFYLRTAAGAYSIIGTIDGDTNGMGMFYSDITDTIYLATDKSISTYGPTQGTPVFNENLYDTYNDIRATGSGQTYTPPTTISETNANKWPFVPDADGLAGVRVNISAIGTGNWTITVHDDADNEIATVTVANATVTATNYLFEFASQIRLVIGASYHLHITSTVADGTVVTGVASQLSDTSGSSPIASADIDMVHNFLISPKSDVHPMIEFTTSIIIGNERYVTTFDETLIEPTDATTGQISSSWDINAITLPAGHEVTCFARFDEFVAIGTDFRGDNVEDFSQGKIFFWDGIETTFNFYIDVYEGGVTTVLPVKNRLFFIAGNRGELFVFGGGEYIKIKRFPKTADDEFYSTIFSSATIYQGLPCFGIARETDSTVFNSGVYTYGSKEAKFLDVLNYAWPISTGTRTGTTLQIGLVKAFGTDLFIGWRDGSTYGIDIVEPGNNPFATAVVEGNVYDGKNPWHKKFIRNIRVDHQPLAANETVQIGYKIDQEASFTRDTANSTDDDTETIFTIEKEFKDLQFEVTIGGTTTSVQVNDVLLDIEPRQESEMPELNG